MAFIHKDSASGITWLLLSNASTMEQSEAIEWQSSCTASWNWYVHL